MNTITDLAIASNPVNNNVKSSNDTIGGKVPEKQEPVDFSKLVIKKV